MNKLSHFPTLPSTNTWMKEHAGEFAHGDVVATDDQTAGRGQRGNFWEAEPGRNLTFSLMLHPGAIAPARQFIISECVALGIVDLLRNRLAPYVAPEMIKVKWPNDIYVGDDKIAGILIEHTLGSTSIIHTVAGIGLNVNQTIFRSPAPNPVSMAQLVPHITFSLPELLEEAVDNILARMSRVTSAATAPADQHMEFLASLWRNDGCAHRYMLAEDSSHFTAVIDDVAPDGMLSLRLPDGSVHSFAFKEVAFL
ncbi:MAG: biotin--[acetyl-CoA-carboxylase] ligase [Bacteroidales bacterium]|nr:biotin--[acetyl-CoA-carboxylase] ligase [Bacteroidales bacterium]